MGWLRYPGTPSGCRAWGCGWAGKGTGWPSQSPEDLEKKVTKMATVSQAYVVFGYMHLHFVIQYVHSFHVHIIYEMLNAPMWHVLDAPCMYLCNKDA